MEYKKDVATSQVGVTLSPNARQDARRAQNAPILKATPLRRSGNFQFSMDVILYESYNMTHVT